MKETTIILLCAVALAKGDTITANHDERTCNYDPEVKKICETNIDNQNVLLAHEYCDKFYKCSNGKLYAYKCAANLLYDSVKEQCEWPHLVDCGDRPLSSDNDGLGDPDCEDIDSGSGNDELDNDNGSNDSSGSDIGDNDNSTCNCNPEEAPSICAEEDSDGVLIAHENCNQFYKCAHGKPVVFTCGPNTLFNPYTEECDWPSNVDCGDRVVPESNENDSADNDNNDDNGNDNGSNDSNGGNDNGSNDNGGACNCNPEEAPYICAGEDSDGILIAHENCNQFYKCAHGKPVVFTCGPNTLFNPYTEECDWPSNVECGDRVVPESNENDSADNDNNDDNGNDNGSNDSNGGNDNGSNDNGGACNCNPEEAPSICAGEDSDGILIAHENCNQFYKCAHGKPVVFTCGPNTLFNPYTEECDWPSNVECGDRVVPESNENDSVDNDNNDDNGNDNGSNDSNGGNDNGSNDNAGACNCNPEEAPSICAEEDSDGVLVAHENCNQFYKCAHGKPVVFTCGPNTLFNPYTEECDWPSNVECGDRVVPESNENDSVDNDNNDNNGNDNGSNDSNGGNDNGSNDNGGACNCNPEEAPYICAGEDSDGILIAHENCNQFYKCAHGKPVVFTCGPNTLFNPYTEECDWPSNVECGDRVVPESNENDSVDNDNNDDNGNDNGSNDSNGGNDNGSNDNGGACNCNPEEAPAICAGEDSDGVLVAHENCNQFYKCAHGKPVVFTCGPNTLFNPYTEECDWPSNVECGDRVVPESNENDSADNNNNDDNGNDNGSNDSNGGNDNGSNDNGGACNCNPEEAPAICAGEDSDGILIAHENCNQFYKCAHGKPVVFTCGPNTLFNPYTEECDWPSNVECGDRVVPESNENDSVDNDNNDDNGNDNGSNDSNGGNDNGSNDNGGACNCNPEEAPSICAGEDSDGILIAHENCNQFYKCAHGKPVVFTCGPNTLFNPYTEECDWPSNVECGDRVVPESNENDSVDNDNNDDNGNDNGSNDSNGGNDNGSNDNGGACNCNPEEAPAICAGEDSDGILIAHENCNQFYKCAHGKPVVFTCGPNTLFNPYTEECDWPSNVECGDRVVPESNENDSVDNDNNDDNGNDNGSNDSNGGNDNGSNDNGGACNCNPEEAPSICAGEDSDGILIAHENCNQFYKCAHGKPVVFTCGPNTLFNPYTEKCDWPSNVECGDRVVPESNENDSVDNDNNDDNGNDNGSNDSNGGNDNGSNDNGGACNCNPEEAPAICAGEDSDGILIAHENCNQFYKCAHGKPVVFTCGPNTLFNPYTEECDWASNVQCGNRTIPNSEEAVEDNQSDSAGDNNDDDDSNDIYDDPGQATDICAKTNSTNKLLAHENCNQFYQCSGGVPIAMTCADNLFFNVLTKECDWPHNVNCGNRILPHVEEDCACNPKNAPILCSKEHSDGKLIAHENCNQFYECFEGVPQPRFCASSLFYNIETEKCDWPQNVNCENRVIVTYSSINKHKV